MKRIWLILALILTPSVAGAQSKAVRAWHARNMMPLFQVIPGSPFGGGGSGGGPTQLCLLNTAQTPDTNYCSTNALGNSFIFAEAADSAFDFAHALATDPTVFIHSHNQSTSEWMSLSHTGAVANITTGSNFPMNLGVNGSAWFQVANGAVGTRSDAQIGWSASGVVGTLDTAFLRTAANVAGMASGDWLQQPAGRSFLAADYTNATVTFSNTALSITVISGRKYTFTLRLFLSDSIAADGVKIDFNGGAATSTNFVAHCDLVSDTGTIVTETNSTSVALATVINAAAMATTNVHMYDCAGAFEPSSSNTFIVRAAQNAHTTGTLTIKRGSWLAFEDNP